MQQPHPPLVFVGESPAALQRAARSGDGWYGHRPSVDEVQSIIDRLESLRVEAGRGHLPFEITIRVPPDVSTDDVERFAEVGVNRLVVEVGSFSEARGRDDLVQLERFAERAVGQWQ